MSYGYTLTRVLNAPVEQVWQAWTTPEQYEAWAYCEPGSVRQDVRPGGAWQATVVTPDGEHPMAGSYVEVVENEKLVIGMDIPGVAEQSTMGFTLRKAEDGTEIVLGQECSTAEEKEMAEQGSGMLLDSLAAFLAK